MKNFVLDCSVTMSWCFKNQQRANSTKILNSLHVSKAVVPSIWSLEVQNVLGAAERSKKITSIESNQFLNLLNSLPIKMDTDDPGFDKLFNKKIHNILRAYQLSSYDAAYLELAIRHDVPLASYDKKLCEAAKGAGVKLYI